MPKTLQILTTRLAVALAIASLFCCTASLSAQAPAAGAAAGPEGGVAAGDEYVLRTYDVSDLVITVGDYPYPGSMQGQYAPPTAGSGGGLGGGGGWGGGGSAIQGGGGGGGYFS